jgi:ribosomal protein L29
MKLKKLKTYNSVELLKEYKEKQSKFKEYKLDLKSGKEKDSGKVKILRRDIARILTLMKIKDLENLSIDLQKTDKKEVKVEKIETTEPKVEKNKKEKVEKKEQKVEKKIIKKTIKK